MLQDSDFHSCRGPACEAAYQHVKQAIKKAVAKAGEDVLGQTQVRSTVKGAVKKP